MKPVEKLREGSKIRGVYDVLIKKGSISNVEALTGSHKMESGKSLRTSRLAGVICELEKYGVICTREKLKTPSGEYKDYVYTLIPQVTEPKQLKLF